MSACGDIEGGPGRLPRHEHGHDDRDVGQVGSAGKGIVQREGFAGVQHRMAIANGAHAGAHTAQMDGHVRRIGDQAAVGVEQGAGKIQPLLDIHGMRRALQGRAHRLGDPHETAVEQLQRHGIGLVLSNGLADDCGGARNADQTIGVGGRAPTRQDCDLCVGAHDERGTIATGQQLGAENRRIAPLAGGEHPYRLMRRDVAIRGGFARAGRFGGIAGLPLAASLGGFRIGGGLR